MKWFMSYVYVDHLSNGVHFCSLVTDEGSPHPIEIVNDWNETLADRHHVLLSFQEVDRECRQEHDCDITVV